MKNTDLPITYQQQLIYGCLDDFSCIAVASNYLGGQYGGTPLAWADAVIDFLYLNQIAGLIELSKPENYPAIDMLNMTLRVEIDSDGHWPDNWLTMYFCSTKRTEAIASRYDLCSWDGWKQVLNKEFISCLTKIYSDFDALTFGCDAAVARKRIAVAKRVIQQLNHTLN